MGFDVYPNNTKLLFLTLGLPSNQRHCNFDKVWPKIIMITALDMDTT